MFSRTLATLLAGGMPLVNVAWETASSAINSRRIAGTSLKRPGTVRARPVAFLQPGKHRIFSRLAVEMIEVGESTGALAAMLNSVAEFYEEDVQNALGAFTTADRADTADLHGLHRGFVSDRAVHAHLLAGIADSLGAYEPEKLYNRG